jgi:hypothetical protein
MGTESLATCTRIENSFGHLKNIAYVTDGFIRITRASAFLHWDRTFPHMAGMLRGKMNGKRFPNTDLDVKSVNKVQQFVVGIS